MGQDSRERACKLTPLIIGDNLTINKYRTICGEKGERHIREFVYCEERFIKCLQEKSIEIGEI